MDKLLAALTQKRKQMQAKAQELLDLAASEEERDFTDDEQISFDGYMTEIGLIDQKIENRNNMLGVINSAPAASIEDEDGQEKGTLDITGGQDRNELDPKHGFSNIGEFALAVVSGSRKANATIDPRLMIGLSPDERMKIGAAPTTYSNEASGVDGGFLIPPEFSNDVRSHQEGVDNFIAMTDNIPVQRNSMAFPKDETVPWGTDGVRAYWEGEADQGNQDKLKLGLTQLRLRKLFVLAPVTEELLEDAGAVASWLPRKGGESIRWKTNDALVNGDGVGKPLGIANSDALVVVSKESAQSDNTLNADNISKMYARMQAGCRGRAVWLVHHTLIPQLMTMTIGDKAIWHPDFRVSPAGTLLGRPIFESQTCQALGTQGDIYFVDWMKYVTINKALQQDTSMHLWFDYAVTAFRLIFRVDGLPWLSAAISDANGSSSTSPYITLEERAGS